VAISRLLLGIVPRNDGGTHPAAVGVKERKEERERESGGGRERKKEEDNPIVRTFARTFPRVSVRRVSRSIFIDRCEAN